MSEPPGRFLMPDPLVQDPASTQNFNRYSYCLNNPLKYTESNQSSLDNLILKLKFVFYINSHEDDVDSVDQIKGCVL